MNSATGLPMAESGNGWTYSGGKLTLTSGEWNFSYTHPANGAGETLSEVKCIVQINEGATVKGGTFTKVVNNGVNDRENNVSVKGGIIAGGTFKSSVNNCGGTIKAGEFTHCWNDNLDDAKGTIEGGTFASNGNFDSVTNYGIISGGIFNGLVTSYWKGVIENGTFNEKVSNYGSISGGYFLSADNKYDTASKVSGGVFKTIPSKVEDTSNLYKIQFDSESGAETTNTLSVDNHDFGKTSVYVVGKDDTELTVTAKDKILTSVNNKANTTANSNSITFKLGEVKLTDEKDGNAYLLKLNAKLYNSELEIGADGKPVTENRKPYGNSGVQGNGWTYDGTTLKLNPTSAKEFTLNGGGMDYTDSYLKCDLEIGANATVKGTITFTKNVTNYGTIEKMEFGSIGGGVYPSLTNNGTVKDCFIAYASVTNNKTMKNVSFVICSELENSADATIENAVVRTDDKNMRYSNRGKIDKAVFEFRPTGAETIRVLKAEQLNSDERVYAKVGECTGGLSGTEVYIVGVPELKVKIADYIYANVTRPVTDVNGDENYGGLSSADANGYHTFTVQSGDTELVLNKTISPTYNENLVIGTDGKPDTANSEPDGKGGWKGANWTYDGTTLTLSGSSWSFSQYPAVTCPVALSRGTALYGGVFENTVSGSGYITGGIFLNTVTVSAENINTGIFKTAPNGTTCHTVKAGDSSKLGVKVNGAEFVDFGTDEALVVNRIGNFVFSVQLRDANGDVVEITNINGKEIGSAYGSHYMNGGSAVEFTMPSENVVLNQESTTKTYTLTVVDGKTSTGKTSEELKEGTEVAVDANVPDDKVFTGWTVSDGATLTYNGKEVDLSENHLVFNMPAKSFTLTANFETARTNILFNEDGTLNLDGVKNNSGDGWYYSEGALYLNPATATEYDFAHVDPQNKDGAKLDAVNVPIHVVNSTVTIAGGKFKAEVESTVINATFKNCVFNGEVDIQTICNVDNCIFTKSSTITNLYGEQNCLFEKEPDESIATKALTEAGGATVTATLDGCAGEVSGEMLYFTGTPTLKVKVADGIVEKANDKPVGKADANGWYTVKAAEDDDGIVLTKGEKTTPNPDDQPKTYTVTVKGGKINNETEVKAAKGTKLTVDMDESEVPEGMTFDVWSIRFPEGVKDTLTGDPNVMLHDPHMAFAMPEADITIEAQYRSSELPGEDDGPSALGTMATVAVGGAAAGILVWQGVSLGVDSYLQLNLPQGVAVPTNRRELVVLLWETAGKPEAALPSLYSDVPAEEIELQKATRWAIDNGLVKPADDSDASRFDPDRYVTKYDVFGAWLKLKKLMK